MSGGCNVPLEEHVSQDTTIIFCDGAAKGNPGPGGWGVVAVTDDGSVTELGGRAPHTTNNKMELTAAIQSLTLVRERPGRVAIYTDSTYVIKGIKEWIHSWKRREWKTMEGAAVSNRELWQDLDALVADRPKRSIEWHYVRGHSGIPGNERVDAIADGLARGEQVAFYAGPLAGYAIAILDIPSDTSVPARSGTGSSSRSSKAAAFSYLSLVDGKLERHTTWSDCERRVKGRSGARFKKATSAADEQAILQSWGVSSRTI